MSKVNYIKGLKFSEKKYSSLSKTELIRIRNKYIAKFKNTELYKNPSSNFIENRLDYYCGCIDKLTCLIREFI